MSEWDKPSNGEVPPEQLAASAELQPLKDLDQEEKDSASTSTEEESEEREVWTNHLDYILSLVGFCVGLGNLWRFPYVCQRNGGGAFLIPFIFFLLSCGLPLFFVESALGQFSGRSSIGVWELCPLFRGLGITMNLLSAICTIYYQTILAWALYYVIKSMSAVLPWNTCDNWFNTELCFVRVGDQNSSLTSESNSTDFNVTSDVTTNDTSLLFTHTSVEEYWQFGVLRVSDGLDTVGAVQWDLALCLLAAWVVVCASVIKGVKSVGKVVYVTALLPYVLLTVLLIRGLTLDGAMDGVVFYLKPDFKKLLKIQVWLEAAVQVFYSLGPAWGTIITYSSFSKFHNNCLRDSIIVSIVSEGTSLYAGLVVFSVLGYMAKQAGVPITEIVSSGPGLGFVAYPEAISTLPLPQMWAFLFFLMIFIVGLDSQFGTFENCQTSIIEFGGRLFRSKRVWVTIALSVTCFVLDLVCVTNGGIYIFQLLDWYSSPFSIMTVAMGECLIVGWVYGIERFSDDVELMIGRRPPMIMKIMISFASPLITGVLVVVTVAQYRPPTYGHYQYPYYAEILGWLVALVSFAAIPANMAWEILTRKGTLLERLRDSLRPTENWKPVKRKFHAMYSGKDVRRKYIFSKNCCEA